MITVGQDYSLLTGNLFKIYKVNYLKIKHGDINISLDKFDYRLYNFNV